MQGANVLQAPDVGLRRVMEKLAGQLTEFEQTFFLTVVICGGTAARLHLGPQYRATFDIDAELVQRVPGLKFDQLSAVVGENVYYWDTQFSTTLGIMQEDYLNRAILVPALSIGQLIVKVLDPHDLVISKVSRWADPDRQDTEALCRAGLILPNWLDELLRDALKSHHTTRSVKGNAEAAMDLVRSIVGSS